LRPIRLGYWGGEGAGHWLMLSGEQGQFRRRWARLLDPARGRHVHHGRATPSTAPDGTRRRPLRMRKSVLGLRIGALAEGHAAVAARAIRIWLSVARSCLEREGSS
jgi:hypothetical protein